MKPTGTLTGNFITSNISTARTISLTPHEYRLGKKPDGTLVLQGAYIWNEGLTCYGVEWRDIPTIEIEEQP